MKRVPYMGSSEVVLEVQVEPSTSEHWQWNLKSYNREATSNETLRVQTSSGHGEKEKSTEI